MRIRDGQYRNLFSPCFPPFYKISVIYKTYLGGGNRHMAKVSIRMNKKGGKRKRGE